MIRIKRKDGFPNIEFNRIHYLDYTKHALERLTDRNAGTFVLKPNFVVVDDTNLSEMYVEDGVVEKVVLRVDYSSNRWLFLTIVIKDSGVKTVWFENKRRKQKLNKNRWQKTNAECVVEIAKEFSA